MELSPIWKDTFLQILREELIPAMGCTEPIAIAYEMCIRDRRVLTYAAIIRAVWGYSDYGSVKKLQVNMKNIRKKMGVTPGEKRYIINELGVGYRMLAEDE